MGDMRKRVRSDRDLMGRVSRGQAYFLEKIRTDMGEVGESLQGSSDIGEEFATGALLGREGQAVAIYPPCL